MKRLALLCLVLVACGGETYGTDECAAWNDPACPDACRQVRERRLDGAGACMRAEPIACTEQQAGRTTMSGCCVREDGAIFRTSSGGPACPYREPAYVGFRDCTADEQAKLRDDDCP